MLIKVSSAINLIDLFSIKPVLEIQKSLEAVVQFRVATIL